MKHTSAADLSTWENLLGVFWCSSVCELSHVMIRQIYKVVVEKCLSSVHASDQKKQY